MQADQRTAPSADSERRDSRGRRLGKRGRPSDAAAAATDQPAGDVDVLVVCRLAGVGSVDSLAALVKKLNRLLAAADPARFGKGKTKPAATSDQAAPPPAPKPKKPKRPRDTELDRDLEEDDEGE